MSSLLNLVCLIVDINISLKDQVQNLRPGVPILHIACFALNGCVEWDFVEPKAQQSTKMEAREAAMEGSAKKAIPTIW